jgi:deoxyribose-phosphate aldolase
LADKLEHVLLRPDLTTGEVDDACARAVESGLAAVTVWTPAAARAVAASEGSRVAVVAALGAPPASAEASEPAGRLDLDELRTAVSTGARHVAVALAPARALGERGSALASELETLCRLAHGEGVHVRAVLQAHLLDDQQLGAVARLAVEAGADLVQTGFGTRAAATTDQVATIRRALPTRRVPIGVVAGGAVDAGAVSELLEHAGADRVAVLDPAAVLRGVAA